MPKTIASETIKAAINQIEAGRDAIEAELAGLNNLQLTVANIRALLDAITRATQAIAAVTPSPSDDDAPPAESIAPAVIEAANAVPRPAPEPQPEPASVAPRPVVARAAPATTAKPHRR